MRIAVVSDEHFPWSGADTEVIVSTAAALGDAGAQVCLVVPRLRGRVPSAAEVCAYYGVHASFSLLTLPGWPWPNRRLRLEKIVHGLRAPLAAAVASADVVLSRDLLPLLVAEARGLPWCFETYRRHGEEKPWLRRLLGPRRLVHGLGAVAHSEAARADLVGLGFAEEAVVMARPGLTPAALSPELAPAEARVRSGLTSSMPLVGYAGNVDPSKGLDEFLAVARLVPEARFVVIGGGPSSLAGLRRAAAREGLANVSFIGHVPVARVAEHLQALDVLLVPGRYRNRRPLPVVDRLVPAGIPGTPLKLYGYLAAGRAIVAADQPWNREILVHDRNALLVAAGEPRPMAEAVRQLLRDHDLARRLGSTARADAQQYTWSARARILLAFFAERLDARAHARA